LDFVIVVVSGAGIFANVGGGAGVFRVLRLLRVIKLVRYSEGMMHLLRTILLSLPALLDIGSLVLLLFFCYGVLGVQLFGKVKHQYTINEYNNFDNFGNAMLALFQVFCYNYAYVEQECMIQPPDCEGDECGTRYAPFYFLTFVAISTFVLLNTLISVILENFKADSTMEDVTEHDIRMFATLWKKFVAAQGKLPVRQLSAFVQALPEPLGLGRRVGPLKLMLFVREVAAHSERGQLEFAELLRALTRRAVRKGLRKLDVAESFVEQIEHEQAQVDTSLLEQVYLQRHYSCVRMRAYKRYRERKQREKKAAAAGAGGAAAT